MALPIDPIYRVLIVGVSGYLGTALAIGLRDEYEVFGTYHHNPVRIDGVTCFPVNGADGNEIIEAVKLVQTDAILFCVNMSPEQCEANPELAEAVLFKTATLYQRMGQKMPYFFYFSCDQVFSSTASPPFNEKMDPRPVSVFEMCKVHGEKWAMALKRKSAVIRMGKLFGEAMGPARSPRYSWLEDFKRQLELNLRVGASPQRIHSHLYIGDAVRATRLLLAGPPQTSELLQWGSPEAMSEFDFLKLFCKKFDFNEELVQSESNSLFNENLSLSVEKFSSKYEFQFQKAQDSLSEYAERLRTGYTKNWV